MYKFIVFDLDGTLANTLFDLANAVNYALSVEDLPTHPTERYNQFVGNGIDNLIKQVLLEKGDDENLHKKVKSNFNIYYKAHLCDDTIAYDGMPELLSELRQLSVKTAIHSNKPHEYVPTIISKLYSDHDFEFVFGNCVQFERKPSPQAVEFMIEKLAVDKSQVLYVGDSDVDVFTAHNAGVKVCGVAWGFRGEEELKSAGADFIAHSAEELLDIIKE